MGVELCYKSLELFLVPDVPVQAAQEQGEHQTPTSCSQLLPEIIHEVLFLLSLAVELPHHWEHKLT